MSRITHTPTRYLSPCPFCGSKQSELVIIEQPNDNPMGFSWWCVRCNCCHTEGPEWRFADSAIRAWNHRMGAE